MPLETLEEARRWLESARGANDPSTCLQESLNGCVMLASVGETMAFSERAFKGLVIQKSNGTSVAKGEASASDSDEFYIYRYSKTLFDAINQMVTSLRHKAAYQSKEYMQSNANQTL